MFYVSDHFSNKSKEIELVRKHPFATSISNSDSSLEISKIPLLLKTKVPMRHLLQIVARSLLYFILDTAKECLFCDQLLDLESFF